MLQTPDGVNSPVTTQLCKFNHLINYSYSTNIRTLVNRRMIKVTGCLAFGETVSIFHNLSRVL